MSSEIIITGAVGLITTAVGSFTSYFFTRKKYHAEVLNDVISGMRSSLDFYQDLSKDNKENIKQAHEEIKLLKADKAVLEKEMHAIKADYELMKAENEVLKYKLEQLLKALEDKGVSIEVPKKKSTKHS